jgi:hypothetical protein
MSANNPSDFDALINNAGYREAIINTFKAYAPTTSNTASTSINKSYVTSFIVAGMAASNANAVTTAINNQILLMTNEASDKTLILQKGLPFDRQTTEIRKLFQILVNFGQTLNPKTDLDIYVNNMDKIFVDLSYAEMKALDGSSLSALSAAGSDISKEQAVNLTGQFVAMNGKMINNELPTYTGVDMQIIVMTPNIITELFTVTTLTYSLHSSVAPVKVLGRSGPKGFAYGDRTVAGSIIATISRQDTFMDMQPGLYTGETDAIRSTHDLYKPFLLPDQLPLMDIVLTFQNEYGDASAMSIYGIKLTDMGQVISMSDSIMEVQYTYIALDITPLRATRSVKTDAKGNVIGSTIEVNDNEYLMMRNRVLNGMSMNRSPFEVATMYNELMGVMQQVDYMTQRRNTTEKWGLGLRGVARTDIARNQSSNQSQ